MSELGSYILNPAQSPAGTKHLSNLLRSGHGIIDEFLWLQSERRVEELKHQDEEALVVWNESVLEKASSLKAKGLFAVRSSVAARLKRIKPARIGAPLAN